MKYSILNLLLFIGISLNAQVSINFADYPVIGDIHKYDSTNIGGLTAGVAGANITWDFSNISGNYNFSRNYIAPSASTYSAAFPTANMVIQDAEAETFLDVTATKVEMLGIVMDLGLGVWTVVPFTNTLTSINFPTDYTDSFNDTYDFDVTADGSSLGADSVNVTSTASVSSTIDAYGKLITPNDTVECLREYVVHTSTTVVSAYVAILGSWTQVQSTTSTEYSYTWVAMGHGSGVMEVTTNSSGNIQTIKLKEVPNTVTNVKKHIENNLSIRTDINNSFAVIEWQNNDAKTILSVYDLSGRCLKSIELEKNYHILDLNEFSSGSYIISISGENNTLSKQLIVK